MIPYFDKMLSAFFYYLDGIFGYANVEIFKNVLLILIGAVSAWLLASYYFAYKYVSYRHDERAKGTSYVSFEKVFFANPSNTKEMLETLYCYKRNKVFKQRDKNFANIVYYGVIALSVIFIVFGFIVGFQVHLKK